MVNVHGGMAEAEATARRVVATAAASGESFVPDLEKFLLDKIFEAILGPFDTSDPDAPLDLWHPPCLLFSREGNKKPSKPPDRTFRGKLKS